MLKRLVPAGLVIVLASWPLHSQMPTPQSSSTGVLRGHVIGPEGRPLRGVRVQVTAPTATFDAVYTDETGAYTSPVPSNNRYTIQASKGGYVTQRLDAATVDPSAPIQLVLGAAITGRVVDRFGDAGVGLGVRIALVEAGSKAPEYVAIADDLGEFRIGSLPAGRYVAQVTRGAIVVDDKTAALAIPLIDSYESTTKPREFIVGAGEEIAVELVHDAGNDAVQRGAIAAASFERDQARSGRRQAPLKDVGTVEGWVADERGRPARGVVIQLEPLTSTAVADPLVQSGIVASSGTRRSFTDADGRYVFAGVQPGRYAVFARRAEYGSSVPSISHGAGQTIEVRGDDALSVPLSVARSSAVAGTVTDRYGDVVEGAAVQLRRVQFAQGRGILQPLQDVAVRVTDDRGRYRIPAVPPGQYYVVAQRDARETYYPARASLAEATGVRVDPGSDLLGTHIALEDAPHTRIFGVVNGATHNLEVVLAESVRAGAAVARPRTAVLKGTDFEFRNVPPGDYVLQVTERGAKDIRGATIAALMEARITAFGTQYVSVRGEPVGPVVLTASPTGTVSGRMRLEASRGQTMPRAVFGVLPSDPDRAPMGGTLTSIGRVDNPLPLAQLDRQGAFSLEGVAGPFRLTALLPDTKWWFKSANIDGVNAAVEPVAVADGRSMSDVEVLLSGDAAAVEGRITDSRVTAFGAAVIAFTTDAQRWFHGSQYVRRTRAGRDGTFAVAGLPPGDYHVIAVDDLPEEEALTNLTAADFLLDLIPRASRVRLPPAERVRVELPLRSTR